MGCVGMNRLIGITGGMSSGKTTISEDILKHNPDYIYVDVDIFRRSLYKIFFAKFQTRKINIVNYSNSI